MLPLELVDLLTAHTTVTANSEKALTIAQEVKQFQETLIKFKQLHVDIHEYACLRAIVLFKTCKIFLYNSFFFVFDILQKKLIGKYILLSRSF